MVSKYEQLVPVLFGEGAIKQLGEQVKALSCKKVLLISDAGVKAAGIGAKAEDSLKAAGMAYEIFDTVPPEPPSNLVDEISAKAKASGVDGVIGVGGGSSLDMAKAVAVMLTNEPPYRQYLNYGEPPRYMVSSVPIVLVPTTAGTGSECTQVSVIHDEVRNLKLSIFVRSTLAILDPELTYTVPPHVTAMTGLDAFSHAVESITAKNWNPRSELLAVSAIEKITKYLAAAVEDGSNKEARYNLCLASNWAGIAFADTDVHYGHASADSLSAAFHTPHGMNCAWVTPGIIKLVAPAVPDKVKLIGQAMGLTFTGSETPEQIGEMVAAEHRKLMKAAKLRSMKEQGITREQAIACAPGTLGSGLVHNCPVAPDEKIAEQLMAEIYDNYQ